MEKKLDINKEMDEIQRVVQDLSRDEGIEITVEQFINFLKITEETTLKNDVWSKLENTESNQIKKGEMQKVHKLAKMYDKSNPDKLANSLKKGDYERPIIVKFDNRYHLVAGNTRLSTAAAIGLNPQVFIVDINPIMKTKKKKQEVDEVTGASSAGAYSAPLFGKPIKKKDLYTHNVKKYNVNEVTDTSVSAGAQYDAPIKKKNKSQKDALSIDDPKTVEKQTRAVKDKGFPKFGGPEGKYVKIKEKCKKFPYCNQGDINALELQEVKKLQKVIKEISEERKISIKDIEKLVLNKLK